MRQLRLCSYKTKQYLAASLAASAIAFAFWFSWPGSIGHRAPRGWAPVSLHIVSDVIIFVSCLSIAISMGWLAHRKRDLIPFTDFFWAFGLFIVSCALTRAMHHVLWQPVSRLAEFVRVVTALGSLSTALILPSFLLKISKLRNEAEKSHRNEARFLAASDSSRDAFYILESSRDENGSIYDFRFVFANTNGAQLLSSTPQLLQDQLLCESFPINRTDGYFEKYRRVVETGEPLEEEFPIDAIAINASWLHIQVRKLGDGVAITTANISKRKEREADLVKTNDKLRQSEAHLLTVQQLARLGDWEFDLETRRMVWSPEVYRIFDRRPEEGPLTASEILDRVHIEDRGRLRSLIERRTGDESTRELYCRVVAKSGRIRYLQGRVMRRVSQCGRTLQLRGAVIDVTEKIELHDALNASDRRFEAFMDNNPALAFIKDRDGKLLYMNRTCRKLWNLDQIALEAPYDAELCSPEIAQGFRKTDRHVLASNQPFTETVTLPVGGGVEATLLTYKFPLNIPGQDHLLGGVSIDITEQINAEKRALQALADKEVLLKEVHHRVKNNLQVISSLLGMQAANLRDGETTTALRESQDRVQSMAMIHESLYGSGSLRDIDFQEYVERLLRELLTSYGFSCLRVRPVVRVIPMRLDMDRAIPCGLILNELISNSLKYGFPNNREGEITVSLAPAGEGQCLLSVEDDGVGLPDGFSLQNTSTLGLRIVSILVKQLGGELQVSSRYGAHFAITFAV